MALRLMACALGLMLSGFPLGILLCEQACAPEHMSATADCHEQGAGRDGASAISGIHLCDEDGSVTPMVAQPVFALAAVPIGPPQAIVVRVIHSTQFPTWEFPPGHTASPIPPFDVALRI